MLRFTREVNCGLVVLQYLARRQESSETPLFSARLIAEQTEWTTPFVAKILKRLTRDEIIDSIQGVKGGYRLRRTPKEISLLEVVKALDGDFALTLCNHTPDGPEHCARSSMCGIRGFMRHVNARVEHILEESTLADFNRELHPTELVTPITALKE